MTVILSIKPEYVRKILSGQKRYEFRKRIFKNKDVSRIIIYATQPVGGIVGEFTIKMIHQDSPERLWEQTAHESGISKDFYDAYYKGYSSAVAIQIDNVKEYSSVLDPNLLFDSFHPPQSFIYLPDQEYESSLGPYASA